jgi:hypothetical protein
MRMVMVGLVWLLWKKEKHRPGGELEEFTVLCCQEEQLQ